MIYSERVKAFLVRNYHVFYGFQGQTQSLFSSMLFETGFREGQFDVRLSLNPFKDLDGRFDLSSTALTKRS